MAGEDDFDVVVIGGGPGGSATAGLLAQQGHKVLVLEKEKFPRYHVGESLITGSMPTIEALGLRERLDRMGYVRKYGGTLMWGRNQGAGTSGSPRRRSTSTRSRSVEPTSTPFCSAGHASWARWSSRRPTSRTCSSVPRSTVQSSRRRRRFVEGRRGRAGSPSGVTSTSRPGRSWRSATCRWAACGDFLLDRTVEGVDRTSDQWRVHRVAPRPQPGCRAPSPSTSVRRCRRRRGPTCGDCSPPGHRRPVLSNTAR